MPVMWAVRPRLPHPIWAMRIRSLAPMERLRSIAETTVGVDDASAAPAASVAEVLRKSRRWIAGVGVAGVLGGFMMVDGLRGLGCSGWAFPRDYRARISSIFVETFASHSPSVRSGGRYCSAISQPEYF